MDNPCCSCKLTRVRLQVLKLKAVLWLVLVVAFLSVFTGAHAFGYRRLKLLLVGSTSLPVFKPPPNPPASSAWIHFPRFVYTPPNPAPRFGLRRLTLMLLVRHRCLAVLLGLSVVSSPSKD